MDWFSRKEPMPPPSRDDHAVRAEPVEGVAFMVLFQGFRAHDRARLGARLRSIVQVEFGADLGKDDAVLVEAAQDVTAVTRMGDEH